MDVGLYISGRNVSNHESSRKSSRNSLNLTLGSSTTPSVVAYIRKRNPHVLLTSTTVKPTISHDFELHHTYHHVPYNLNGQDSCSPPRHHNIRMSHNDRHASRTELFSRRKKKKPEHLKQAQHHIPTDKLGYQDPMTSNCLP